MVKILFINEEFKIIKFKKIIKQYCNFQHKLEAMRESMWQCGTFKFHKLSNEQQFYIIDLLIVLNSSA